MRHNPSSPALLCVANFPANTGYAWDFFEGIYARIADRLAGTGIRTFVGYPAVASPPRTLQGSAARPVELDATLGSPASVRNTVRFIRQAGVRVVYSKDRPAWHPAYPLLRAVGVRSIVVYDQTSGTRTVPGGPKRLGKSLLRCIPGTLADRVLTVSDYVARRQIEVGLVPSQRVQRIWNGLAVPPLDPGAPREVRQLLGISDGRLIVACTCRATPEKGVEHLFRAFDRLLQREAERVPPPALVFVGNGPQMQPLYDLRRLLPSREHIFMTGYRSDATKIVAGADISVVPSVWEEAFGLAALEAMASARPVVASAVGGIREIVEHGVTGLLVPPGDQEALAFALGKLLRDPRMRKELGEAGRRRVANQFSPEAQLQAILSVLKEGFLPR